MLGFVASTQPTKLAIAIGRGNKK